MTELERKLAAEICRDRTSSIDREDLLDSLRYIIASAKKDAHLFEDEKYRAGFLAGTLAACLFIQNVTNRDGRKEEDLL